MATQRMATQKATITYASRSAVYGSNAYDLSRVRGASPSPDEYVPAGRPEIRPAAPSPKAAPRVVPEKAPASAPKAAPRTVKRTSGKTQKAYAISLYSAVGFIVVAVMMVFVLLAYVRYAEMTNETARLETQLSQLNEQERKLKIAYEDAFDVNEIEQYATHYLGMSQAAESQLGTISVIAQDTAVVADIQNDGDENESIGTFLASLVAYFK